MSTKRAKEEVDHMSRITVDRLKYHMKEGGSDEAMALLEQAAKELGEEYISPAWFNFAEHVAKWRKK